MKTVNYRVTKEGSNLFQDFVSREEAIKFCNSFIALENARGAEFPLLTITEVEK